MLILNAGNFFRCARHFCYARRGYREHWRQGRYAPLKGTTCIVNKGVYVTLDKVYASQAQHYIVSRGHTTAQAGTNL